MTRYSRWRVLNRSGFRVTEMHDDVIGYGRVEQFIVFDTGFLQGLTEANGLPQLFDKPFVVAALQPIPQTIHHPDCGLIEYRLSAGGYAAVQLIDASRIVSLVGRVKAHGGTKYIVDRETVVGQMDMLDVTLNTD
jgi:hypothetical protein